MPSHNTNASHLEGPLCHLLTTSLPGVVAAMIILWLYRFLVYKAPSFARSHFLLTSTLEESEVRTTVYSI